MSTPSRDFSRRTGECARPYTIRLCLWIRTRILMVKGFDSDRDLVIARARDAGVQTIVAIGNGDGPGQVDCAIRLQRSTILYTQPSAFIRMKRDWPTKPAFQIWSGWPSIRK